MTGVQRCVSSDLMENARAIYEEFEEWIELDVDDEEEIEIVSIESEED